MNNTIRRFSYSGMFLGFAFGWTLGSFLNWNIGYTTKGALGIFFGIIGIILSYKLYLYLKKK